MKSFKVLVSGTTPMLIKAENESSAWNKVLKIFKGIKDFCKRDRKMVEWNEKGYTVEELIKKLQTFPPTYKVIFPSASGTIESGHVLYKIRGVSNSKMIDFFGKNKENVVALESHIHSTTVC